MPLSVPGAPENPDGDAQGPIAMRRPHVPLHPDIAHGRGRAAADNLGSGRASTVTASCTRAGDDSWQWADTPVTERGNDAISRGWCFDSGYPIRSGSCVSA